jgi:MraZ protein
MDRFVSHTTLRLDSKGRVSIPAPFRAVLSRDGVNGVYCYPALDRPAIDAEGNALMAEIEARYASICEKREQFALALDGTRETLRIDREGRVQLSDSLKRHAGITEAATFVGLGHKFQICESGRFQSELAQATQKVRKFKGEVGFQSAARNALGARE